MPELDARSRALWQGIRRGLLAVVRAIEEYLGISPKAD